jgi:hypothetical protein
MARGAMAENRQRALSRWLSGCLVAALVGGALGIFVAALLLKAWADCSAGASGFNQLGAAIVGTVTALISGLVFAVSTALLRRNSPKAIVAASLILASLTAYMIFSLNLPASPSGPLFGNNGAGTCPGNVPPWWPVWLPV